MGRGRLPSAVAPADATLPLPDVGESRDGDPSPPLTAGSRSAMGHLEVAWLLPGDVPYNASIRAILTGLPLRSTVNRARRVDAPSVRAALRARLRRPSVVRLWLLVGIVVATTAPLPALAAPAARAAPVEQGTAGSGIEIAQNVAQVTYPSEIRFQLRAESSDTIVKVALQYQVDDSRVVNQGVPAYSPGRAVTAVYAWRVSGVLLPGSEVRYQWVVETAGGGKLTTPQQAIAFDDERFAWQVVASRNVEVHSYVADRATVDGLLQQAADTLGRLEREFGLAPERPIRVYAYATQEHYLSAIAPGGVATPAFAAGSDRVFVLTALPQNLVYPLLRREVAQAVFVQQTKNPYVDPPLWLSEGFPQYLAPDTQLLSPSNMQALQQLARANRLLSLRSISGTFPTGQQERALALVQSYSVVRYIVDQYGAEKLRSLLQAIKEGSAPDDALKKALGVTMDQLDGKWKEAVKSGRELGPTDQAERPGAQQQAGTSAPSGSLDRATRFWRGVFGEYTQWVMIGAAAVVGVMVVLLTLGSLLRRRTAEDEI